jgi:hypothetical protein
LRGIRDVRHCPVEGLVENDVHLVDGGGGEAGIEAVPVEGVHVGRVQALEL